MSWDEDDVKKKAPIALPRNLEALSVEELKEYDTLLDEEKQRVAEEITRKKAVRAAADNFFK